MTLANGARQLVHAVLTALLVCALVVAWVVGGVGGAEAATMPTARLVYGYTSDTPQYEQPITYAVPGRGPPIATDHACVSAGQVAFNHKSDGALARPYALASTPTYGSEPSS